MVVLAAGGALSAFLVNRRRRQPGGEPAAQLLPVNTAKVTQQTLNDTETADGELGFGTTTTAVNRAAGTITGLPDSGQELRRGSTVYSVDNKPTTLLYGALPAYRRLADGSEGPDVRQLEQNLQALGYTGFTVDDEYTARPPRRSRSGRRTLAWTRPAWSSSAASCSRPAHDPRGQRARRRRARRSARASTVLTYTGTAKAVTVELDAADQRLAQAKREGQRHAARTARPSPARIERGVDGDQPGREPGQGPGRPRSR